MANHIQGHLVYQQDQSICSRRLLPMVAKIRLRFKHELKQYRDALQQQLYKHRQKGPRTVQAIDYYLKLG
ncbi:hypothetical protein BGZ95_005498, partial [Linnemannia exigua]